MAERKNTEFDRPGGYAMPTGATTLQRKEAAALAEADIRLYGDDLPPYGPAPAADLVPAHQAADPDTRIYLGDCRDVLAALPERGQVDLVFADPPFNWDVPYDEWHDGMPRKEYERFTFDWLDACVDVLAPHGAMWVNIPDDSAAEVVVHLKRRGLTMINWCIWHFRFGQHRDSSFIMSKVHVLYFAKDPDLRTWNAEAILEPSDRASIYADPRTMAKESNKGMRVPMDVWYGKYWGRIQGNNKERRHRHHNQIPEVYLERVIRACTNEGDLVLDPFLGSGTTSTVARAWGRRSIGIEYSAENAASAWERITEIGMIRKGASAGQSSAIFPQRKTERKPRAKATPEAAAAAD
ncbi:MAG: DNA-methyltransferase [Planctomycetota bacterium]|jgi:site-specific DNA-methyltransferase (adenine-specific)